MSQISLRVDDNVKKQAESVCSEIGMSLSTAINIYLKRLGRDRRVPFDVSADPFYSDSNVSVLQSRINDVENGDNLVTHELIEV
jgi:DNA-damage-inducible protein J